MYNTYYFVIRTTMMTIKMKNQLKDNNISKGLLWFVVLAICFSALSAFLFHCHYCYNNGDVGSLVHSEEFCPICWFILQIVSFSFLYYFISFFYLQLLWNFLIKRHFSYEYPLIFPSRAPPFFS